QLLWKVSPQFCSSSFPKSPHSRRSSRLPEVLRGASTPTSPMSNYFVDRLFSSLNGKGSNTRRGAPRRPAARRHLSFESLETRQMMSATPNVDLTVNSSTGEKPQSKIWEYQGQWYSVLPNKSGTWVWRLDGTTWTPQLKISTNASSHADVKVDGDVAH